jgi:hypothetical protein
VRKRAGTARTLVARAASTVRFVPRARTTVARDRASVLRLIALLGLLATPFVLAFASGGYAPVSAPRFETARLGALIATCVFLALAAATTPRPLPRTPAGVLALGGLWALAAWTGASIAWAPLHGPAFHDMQRVLTYALAFTAATALLKERTYARVVEPFAVFGATVVLGYGLAGRLLPGIVHQTHGAAAGGRLDQPLTYWNAVGSLAAITLVLCARLAGDGTRRVTTRMLAAAACAPAGMALYLTYSRGALGAAAVGLLVLLAAAPDRRQLRAVVLAALTAALATATAAPFPAVASLHRGSHAQGLAVLILLVVAALAAAAVARWLALREAAERLSSAPLRLHALRPLLVGAAAVVLVGFVVATAAGEHRSANPATGATATRLTSLQSHRYAYWKVALGAFGDHPLNGLGSGGFAVRWLERRTFPEGVHDAHSLYIETAAELGIVGLLALAAFIGGLALSARATMRVDAVLAAGPLAAVVTWATHAGVDWLWEMPAVSLVALALAALLVAQAEDALQAMSAPRRPARRSRARQLRESA